MILNAPIFVLGGFQKKDGLDNQKRNIVTISRPRPTSATCKFWSGKNPENGLICHYGDGKFCEAYLMLNSVSDI